MERQKPIGIFDSGVGGLSIARAIKRLLPDENLVYFADVAFSPYGNKPSKVIKQRSEDIANFLISQDCKIIVIACNTATVNSINDMRLKISIPIVGIEPAIKPATLLSKTGVIGVLATQQTLNSESFQQLKAKYDDKVNIATQACPKFVSLVESLDHHHDQASEVAEQYIRPLLSQGCDQIVLGCSHFSFLSTTIKNIVGDDVNIIDTAAPVAAEVKRRLRNLNLENTDNINGLAKFWTSGALENTKHSISELWQQDVLVFEANSLLI